MRRNFRPWICKVTPADCACQEGNTTGCIPSNDGLGAGFGPDFPHCGKQRAVGASGCVVKDSHFGTYFRGRAGLPRVFQSSLRDEFLNLVSVPSAGSAGLFSWVPTGPGATAYVGLTPDARPKSDSPSTISLRRTLQTIGLSQIHLRHHGPSRTHIRRKPEDEGRTRKGCGSLRRTRAGSSGRALS